MKRKQIKKQTQVKAEAQEPWLVDCPYCAKGTMHDARYVEMCPLNPHRPKPR